LTKRIKSSLLVGAAVATLAIGTTLCGPAKAEESLGESNARACTELAPQRYETLVYPNTNQAFYLADKHEVRFDIKNSKFFKIEYADFRDGNRGNGTAGFDPERLYCLTLQMEVEFFNPRGERVAKLENIRPNWWIAVPHSDTSMEYDRLQVRIRNHSGNVRDFRFISQTPVAPVKGTPIPVRHDIDI
jgi:hypothetical protein